MPVVAQSKGTVFRTSIRCLRSSGLRTFRNGSGLLDFASYYGSGLRVPNYQAFEFRISVKSLLSGLEFDACKCTLLTTTQPCHLATVLPPLQ